MKNLINDLPCPCTLKKLRVILILSMMLRALYKKLIHSGLLKISKLKMGHMDVWLASKSTM